MTNHNLIDKFITYITAERRYSPLTVRNYLHDLMTFEEWGRSACGKDFSLREVTAADVGNWVMHLSDTGRLKSSSINRAVATLRSFYRYLRRKDIIRHDIFISVQTLPTSRRLPTFVPKGNMDEVVNTVLQRKLPESLFPLGHDELFYLAIEPLSKIPDAFHGDFAWRLRIGICILEIPVFPLLER